MFIKAAYVQWQQHASIKLADTSFSSKNPIYVIEQKLPHPQLGKIILLHGQQSTDPNL